ncbi:MAG: DUF4838 domain-containing protein [Sedimentisphaerales bacterium]
MKSKVVFTSSILVTIFCCQGFADIALCDNGRTSYKIVLPENADISTTAAAVDFAVILKEMTGAVFPVVYDFYPAAEASEIILGIDNKHIKDHSLIKADISFGEYQIITSGNSIIIAGGPERGLINGIYGFCRDYLDCRWLTPGCQYIPSKQTVKLPEIIDCKKPAFRYRSADSIMQWDANWTVRNRLNESKAASCGERPSAVMLLHNDARTATMANSWNPHAFQSIPEAVYKDNELWRAEIEGSRKYIGDPAQRAFCLSNKEFNKWVAQWTLRQLRQKPNMPFISITHTDIGISCDCKDCLKAYKKIGISGLNIQFANNVAKTVAVEFPDVSIITFAYHHTFAPPGIKAHPNVRAVWAPIDADYAYAINEGEVNIKDNYLGQLQQWCANTKQLGIWYYQYSHFAMLPRPCLFATQKSLQKFKELGVDQVFIEMFFNPCWKKTFNTDTDKNIIAYPCFSDYYTRRADHGSMFIPYGLEHLRGYIYSELLWDTDISVNKSIEDFCRIYYGQCHSEIFEYVMLTEDLASYEKKSDFSGYDGLHIAVGSAPIPNKSYLLKCSELFDAAMSKTKNDPVFRKRVELARISIDFAILLFVNDEPDLKKKASERFFRTLDEIDPAFNTVIPRNGDFNLEDIKNNFLKNGL